MRNSAGGRLVTFCPGADGRSPFPNPAAERTDALLQVGEQGQCLDAHRRPCLGGGWGRGGSALLPEAHGRESLRNLHPRERRPGRSTPVGLLTRRRASPTDGTHSPTLSPEEM